MILPSASDLIFITVMNHLTAGNGVSVLSSSPQVELSLNVSTLASVAENSAVVSDDIISRVHLHLSCGDTDCSTQLSVGWSFSDEAVFIVSSPQTDIKCSSDGNYIVSHVQLFV